MRLVPHAFITLSGALILGAFLTSSTLNAAAASAGEAPWALIAADLGVSDSALSACLAAARPDAGASLTASPRMAVARLLPCLQASNPDLTPDGLGMVMEQYRPAGPSGF